MLAKRNAKPRFLETRGARFRLAYNEYGWKILLVCLWVVPFTAFLVWVASTKGKTLATPNVITTKHGFSENDGAIFQAEILYAAAHRYAGDHSGRLPDAANWQTALRPYLARAGAASALGMAQTGKGAGRFVMNRDLSSASLAFVPNPSRTLLFWQAVTSKTDLPSSSYKRAKVNFGGIACDGRAYFLIPTGQTSDPLIWRTSERWQPPHDLIDK